MKIKKKYIKKCNEPIISFYKLDFEKSLGNKNLLYSIILHKELYEINSFIIMTILRCNNFENRYRLLSVPLLIIKLHQSLFDLVYNKYSTFREFLAKNPYISEKLMEKITDDKDHRVRYCLAQNKNISDKALKRLSNDRVYYVRREALKKI